MQPAASPRNIFLLLIPGTLWGVSFLLIEIVLESIPPLTLTTGRSLIAVAPMLILMYVRGRRLPGTWEGWRPYFILGLANNALPYLLISWGQIYIDSGLATILVSTMPLFTIVLAHLFLAEESLTRSRVAGIVLGLTGVIVLIGPSAMRGLGSDLRGQLAVIGGALFYALSTVYSRHYLQQTRSRRSSTWDTLVEFMTGQFVVGGVAILPLSLLFERPWTLQATSASIGALLALALLVTIVAVLVYYYLLDVAGASFASTVVYLMPVNGVFWGSVILNEPITWQVMVALVLVLSGIAVVNGAGLKIGRRLVAGASLPGKRS